MSEYDKLFKEYMTLRDEALRSPTVELAVKIAKMSGDPISGFQPENLLAGLHKARFLWSKSTKAMLDESEKFLKENGFEVPDRCQPEDFLPKSEIYNK